jgi:multiple sugar transport system substrate-binding protein
VIAMVSVILAACAGGVAPQAPAQPAAEEVAAQPAAEAVKLVAMTPENELTQEAIDAFEAANPGITIERIDPDETKLAAMIAAGEAPDIIRASGADTPTYVTRGWVLDLTPYFETSEVLQADDMAPSVDYFRYEGGWYGMNSDWSPDQSFFISKSAAADAGIELPPPDSLITYAQAGEWARAMTKTEGERVLRVGMAYSDYWDGTVQTILMENGEDLYSEDFSKANISDNPTVVEFLTFMAELAKDNAIFNPLNPSPEWVVPDLMNGRAASATNGYWIQGGFRGAENPVIAPDDYVMYPALSWGGKEIVNPALGGAGWFISATTEHPDEAWKLFEYYMGGEPALNRARTGWGLPALKSLYSEIPVNEAWQSQYIDNVKWEQENTIQTPRRINPYYSTSVFNSIWQANLERYLKGEISIEEAINNLDTEVNKAIADGMAAAQ